jgi:hypothetical protein
LSHHANKAIFNVGSFQANFSQSILQPLSDRAKMLGQPPGLAWIEPGSNNPCNV